MVRAEHLISRRKFLAVGGAGAAFPLINLLLPKLKDSARTRWVMANVSPSQEQADLHLIDLPSGRRLLIDVGEAGDAPGEAVRALRRLGVDEVDLVVISHFHRDHYVGLLPAIEAGLKVGAVVCNVPRREIADAERPWGCNWDDVQHTLRFFEQRGIPWRTTSANDVLISEETKDVAVRLQTLAAYDGVDTPVGRTDINDTSIICRLEHGSQSVLFTGDLNRPLGTYLANSQNVSATLIKIPHHGTDGTVPRKFLDQCASSAAFVPSPRRLWFSDRSRRIRDYYNQHHGVPCYVSGLHGDVSVHLSREEFSVSSEYDPYQLGEEVS